MAGGGLVDEALTRRWLANLARPERLADSEMRALLRAHGRDAGGPPVEVGRAAAQLLQEAVDALRPPPGVPAARGLPHRVLTTCFLEGVKSSRAAGMLGLSERQLSRERSRAISLLAARLAPPCAGGPSAAPPALPDPLLPRPQLSDALASALRVHRRVCVAGPAGAGKTVLVAAHAAALPGRTFWYRVDARVNRALPSLLFDLGEHLAPDDPTLAAYARAALPDPDPGLATRIALAALAGPPRLLVLDGFGDGRVDAAVESFLDEVTARLSLATVVTIAREPRPGTRVDVPPFGPEDVAALLALYGLPPDDGVAAALHAWTRGDGRSSAGAAEWLARRRSAGALRDVLRSPALLGPNLRGLSRAARRRYGGRSVSRIS